MLSILDCFTCDLSFSPQVWYVIVHLLIKPFIFARLPSPEKGFRHKQYLDTMCILGCFGSSVPFKQQPPSEEMLNLIRCIGALEFTDFVFEVFLEYGVGVRMLLKIIVNNFKKVFTMH